MDTLYEHISLLNTKVDSLAQLVEQLSTNLIEVSSECRFGKEQLGHGDRNGRLRSSPVLLDMELEHKDILSDSSGYEASHTSERQLSPEIQIQRLTAQLTAAYNRIAALEEQLLAKRIH